MTSPSTSIRHPYRSGLPIDAIPECAATDDSPAQKRRKEAYRSIVGSLNWLASSTRPDLAPVHSFLSSYCDRPSPGHMKAALYALHYVHSTHDYGITFSSIQKSPIHCYLHFPDSSDVEAYSDALPPSPSQRSKLTTYSDACWGSQVGNAVKDGTYLPLFKFRSMSGAIVFRMGGPIAWKSVRQDKTSLSSCEAEIRATNEGGKLTVATRNLAVDFVSTGYNISDTSDSTDVYNDNQSCVNWSYNMTMKQIRHMELRDNSVKEWVADKTLKVLHVKGTCNPADIFTKEMRDGAHFRRLRDSSMCRHSDFLRDSLALVYQRMESQFSSTPSSMPSLPRPVSISAQRVSPSRSTPSFFDVLCANALFRTNVHISHFSSVGRAFLCTLSSAPMGGVCLS